MPARFHSALFSALSIHSTKRSAAARRAVSFVTTVKPQLRTIVARFPSRVGRVPKPAYLAEPRSRRNVRVLVSTSVALPDVSCRHASSGVFRLSTFVRIKPALMPVR